MNANQLEHHQWLSNGCTFRLVKYLTDEYERLIKETTLLAIDDTNPVENFADNIIRSKLSRAYELRKSLDYIKTSVPKFKEEN